MFRSASLFIGTSFTVVVFTIFAASNVDSIVGIPHKINSMQRILIHLKNDLFVKYAHLHPGCAANLVARSRYYHCHWTVLDSSITYRHAWWHTKLWPSIFNSSRLSDAFMCQRISPLLFQVMDCRLFGAKPLFEPIVAYCQFSRKEDFQWILIKIQNVVCKNGSHIVLALMGWYVIKSWYLIKSYFSTSV